MMRACYHPSHETLDPVLQNGGVAFCCIFFEHFTLKTGTFSGIDYGEQKTSAELRQPRLWPIEALSGFRGEYRSRLEGRNFNCSDTWEIQPDDLPRSDQATHTGTQSHSLQRSHPHLNSIFASKLHAEDPLHCVICIRLIRWLGAHFQAVVIVMEIILLDPEKLPSSLWSRNLRVLPKLMPGHVIAYAGDLNPYHNILCFFAGVSTFILKKGGIK